MVALGMHFMAGTEPGHYIVAESLNDSGGRFMSQPIDENEYMRARREKVAKLREMGIFSKEGISHNLYRKVGRRMDDLVEDLPFFVDVVNLNRADSFFLRESSKYWSFLTGRLSDWIEVQRKTREE